MNKLTFKEFILEKYDEKLIIGYNADQEDGARYANFQQWFNDQDLEEQIIACDGDPLKDSIEYEELLEPEPCEHQEVDAQEGCLSCGAEFHEVRNTDPDLEDR